MHKEHIIIGYLLIMHVGLLNICDWITFPSKFIKLGDLKMFRKWCHHDTFIKRVWEIILKFEIFGVYSILEGFESIFHLLPFRFYR